MSQDEPRDFGDDVALDAKSALQEFAQARKLSVPRYQIVHESGPEHAKLFTVEARVGKQFAARADGASKKTGRSTGGYSAASPAAQPSRDRAASRRRDPCRSSRQSVARSWRRSVIRRRLSGCALGRENHDVHPPVAGSPLRGSRSAPRGAVSAKPAMDSRSSRQGEVFGAQLHQRDTTGRGPAPNCFGTARYEWARRRCAPPGESSSATA